MYRLPQLATEIDQLAESAAVEEIVVPVEALQELRDSLEVTHAWLPTSTRAFKEWKIGLLSRRDG